MRDFFKLIGAHISGKLKNIGNLQGHIYLFYVALAGSFGAVFMNAYISKSAYLAILQAGSSTASESDASVMTWMIALLGFISAGFLASVILDRSQGIDRKRGYVETTAAILFACAIIGVDVWANLQGSTFRAFENTSDKKEVVDQTTDKISLERQKVIAKYEGLRTNLSSRINALKNDRCQKSCPHIVEGGAAHWAGHLTKFGKPALRELENKYDALEAKEEKALTNVDKTFSGSLTSSTELYTTTLSVQKGFWKFSAVGAYLIALIASLYASGFSRRALDLVRKIEGKDDIPFYDYDASNINYRAFAIEGGKAVNNGSRTNASRKLSGGGYEIECKNCGEVAIKHRPNAKYCSDACRIEYNEREKGYSVDRIKRKKMNGAKIKN